MQKPLLALALLFLIASCKPGADWPQPELNRGEGLVAVYNVENLFDTIDDPDVDDQQYLPESKLGWDTEKYQTKLNRIATVIRKMEFPVLLGLSEVENRAVLEDLLQQSQLQKVDYRIFHDNTNDPRGIDCALLYRPKYFQPDTGFLVPIFSRPEGPTGRQILIVEGQWGGNGDSLVIAVNHWPSRYGGKDKTERKRIAAARQLVMTLAARYNLETSPILIMGDFNDDPTDRSIERTLNAGAPGNSDASFYNLTMPAFQEGQGSYNYRGNWNMLDQLIVSPPLMDCADSFCFRKAGVFRAPALLFDHPRNGLSPNRTHGGPNYYGGYSDHLPVYAPVRLPDQISSNK